MSSRDREDQQMVRLYKQEMQVTDVNMSEVAEWLEKRDYEMPEPLTPVQLLARRLSRSARRETRIDSKTGHPYRVNHPYPVERNGQIEIWWIDIDQRAPRDKMLKSGQGRRKQMLGDAIQYTLDFAHWNSINPEEEPLVPDVDFSDEVEWRLKGGDGGMRKAG